MLCLLFICIAGGMIVTCLLPRRYSSTAQIIVALSQGNALAHGADSIPLLQDLQSLTETRSIKSQVSILQSDDIWQQAVSTISAMKKKYTTDAKLDIDSSHDTDVVGVTVESRDTALSAQLANAVVNAYMLRDADQYRVASKTALAYITAEMKRVGADLYAARKQLAAYECKTGLFHDDTVTTGKTLMNDTITSDKIKYLTSIESQLTDAMISITGSNAEFAKTQRALFRTAPQVKSKITAARDPQRDQIEQLIQQYEAQRIELMQTYQPNAPEVQAIDSEIVAAKQRLTRHLETIFQSQDTTLNPIHDTLEQQYVTQAVQLAGLNARIAALKQQHTLTRKELTAMVAQSPRASELANHVTELESTYALLSTNYQTIKIGEEAIMPRIQVITTAIPATKPIFPNFLKSFAMLTFLGLFIAFFGALLLEAKDDRIRTADELEQDFGLPVLGNIPWTATTPVLLTHSDVALPLLESFRILRGNLLLSDIDRNTKVITVTSTSSGEGKSTSAINLATVLAMSGKRVILVDGDFHRPTVNTYLELKNTIGTTDIMLGNATVEEVLQSTSISELRVLTTGQLPPSPSDLLSSQSMAHLIHSLADQCDHVIIDAPPTVGLSDVPIISSFVDGVLLVVSVKETKRQLLRAALRSLQHVNAHVLGCVVNKLDQREYGYYGYYGHYSDAYYTGVGKEKGTSSADKAARKGHSEHHKKTPTQP